MGLSLCAVMYCAVWCCAVPCHTVPLGAARCRCFVLLLCVVLFCIALYYVATETTCLLATSIFIGSDMMDATFFCLRLELVFVIYVLCTLFQSWPSPKKSQCNTCVLPVCSRALLTSLPVIALDSD